MITQSQAQSMHARNAVEISFLEEVLSNGKQYIQELYSKCDPFDSSTEGHFHRMNSVRSELRRIKMEIKRLASIQYELKKIRSKSVA